MKQSAAPLALATLLAASVMMAAPAQAQVIIQDGSILNDGPILNLIGEIEGPDGYNDVYGGARVQPPKPLTQMSVGEVLAYQDRMRKAGSKSSAVGRYQFIHKTLAFLVSEHNIDHRRAFDGQLQDHLARLMMNDCGLYEKDVAEERIGNCLARVWAALPVLSGRKAGQSYYHGTAGNKALTSRTEVLAALDQRFQPTRKTQRKRSGFSNLPAISNKTRSPVAERIPLK